MRAHLTIPACSWPGIERGRVSWLPTGNSGSFRKVSPMRHRRVDHHVDAPRSRVCIYCSEERPVTEYNKEHVLPEAFGRFRDAPPRLDCVCKKCNGFFGTELEPALTRDSPEALLRLEGGQKPVDEAGDLRRERFRLFADEGPWAGKEVMITPGAVGSVQLVPQAGFVDREKGGFAYFTERDLGRPDTPNPERFDLSGKIDIVATTREEAEHIMEVLDSLGIKVRNAKGRVESSPGEPIWVRKSHSIDATIERAVAKVAFNYLAHVAGVAFVGRDDFHPARRFIRYGEELGWQVMSVQDRPLLYEDSTTQRQTSGHLLASYWSASPGRRPVVWVSFYNELTYRVVLVDNPRGLWCEIERGYHFDIVRMKAERLIPMVNPGPQPGDPEMIGWFLRRQSSRSIKKIPWQRVD